MGAFWAMRDYCEEGVRKLVQKEKLSFRDSLEGWARKPRTPAFAKFSQADVHGFRARGLCPRPRKDAVFEFPDSLESGVRPLRGFGGCPRPALCTAAAYDAGAADALANMLAFLKDTAAARC